MPVGTPIQVRLPDEELSALDGYRRGKLNPPSRGQAIRELTRSALNQMALDRLLKVQLVGKPADADEVIREANAPASISAVAP